MPKNDPQPDIQIECTGELVAITDLRPHPRNPREHSKAQISAIAEAIRRNGFRRPVVASRLSGVIIAGHGTVAAAKILGMDQVPVDWQDFPDEAAESAFLISDNHLARMGTVDSRMISEIIASFDGIDLEAFGFSSSDQLKFGDGAKDDGASDRRKGVTKNGATTADEDDGEEQRMIVATVPASSHRRLTAWMSSNKVDSIDEALAMILGKL